ncbi:MAG: DUF2309 domain-containing protein [Alicyclobacillus sp.]|nr:DUF2309 domain-containing protein [Alicyclobacillus sp.]
MSSLETASKPQPTPASAAASAQSSVLAWVQAAADGIAPVWPIATFIARHPWPELEHLPFADAAVRLHAAQGIRLHPSPTLIQAALDRGELAPHHLLRRLHRWLDRQTLPLPRAQVTRVCQAWLWSFAGQLQTTDLAHAEETLRLAAEALHHGVRLTPAHPWCVPTVSQRIDSYQAEHQNAAAKAKSRAQRLDALSIQWCKLYLDEGQAVWSLPGRHTGLYATWRRLIQEDPALPKVQRRRLADWPTSAAEGLLRALTCLGVSEEERVPYLRAHLLALPGWAGMLLWTAQETKSGMTLLLEYLAVRLALEWALCADHLPLAPMSPAHPGAAASSPALDREQQQMARLLDIWFRYGGVTPQAWRHLTPAAQQTCLTWLQRFLETERWILWLEAWEDTYADTLRQAIKQARSSSQADGVSAEPPQAQLLFCIDVRSADFRRHLEAMGPFATYGCAGFFNLPIRTRALDSAHTHPSCPAIVQPLAEVPETLSATVHPGVHRSYRQRRNGLRLPGELFKKVKQHWLASLALPELSGPWLGLHTLLRTLLPAANRWWLRLKEAAERTPPTALAVRYDASAPSVSGLPLGLTLEQMADMAGGLLRSLGINTFAPLVVVCGHEAQTVNNPHAAALDCGACGGAAGRFNARAFAAICNLPEVRAQLARTGLCIPPETVFVAAEHITTTDELRWLEVPPLSPAALTALNVLEQVLPQVQRALSTERVTERIRRATDWSEVRPEWGLAGNAAFIVGRRQLTAHVPLAGRVFLHSYDWRFDPNGDLLAAIVAGPVTVAQWINLQYLASTVAPHLHGSGNKTTQTVTCGRGVMQGNGSDLLAGLPWQSVALADDTLYHRPLRLLVVLEAPADAVAALLQRDAAFRQKVENGWLHLASIDPISGAWHSWDGAQLARPVASVG